MEKDKVWDVMFMDLFIESFYPHFVWFVKLPTLSFYYQNNNLRKLRNGQNKEMEHHALLLFQLVAILTFN